jgi:hypothetical protein
VGAVETNFAAAVTQQVKQAPYDNGKKCGFNRGTSTTTAITPSTTTTDTTTTTTTTAS